MISIRKGCFETNSSSMHSLAIWKKVKPYDDYYLSLGTKYDRDKENGTFELLERCYDEDDYNFHRAPYKQLTTPIEKLRYIVGLYISYKYPESDDLVTKCIDSEPEYYFTDKEVESELLRLIEKYTGYKKVQWYKKDEECKRDENDELVWYDIEDYPSTSSYNDSGEDVMNFIRRKNITLEDLIFKPNYTIQVDGDEYQDFKKMFEINMINLDNLEDISSGIDYWTDNIYTFWIDEVLNKEYGPIDDCKPYLERCKEDIRDDMLIEIDTMSMEPVTGDMYRVASEFLQQYKDRCRIKFPGNMPDWVKEKYFSWTLGKSSSSDSDQKDNYNE